MALEISTSPSEDTLIQQKWNGAIKIAIVINIIFFFCTHTRIHIHNKLYVHLSYKICQLTLSKASFPHCILL